MPRGMHIEQHETLTRSVRKIEFLNLPIFSKQHHPLRLGGGAQLNSLSGSENYLGEWHASELVTMYCQSRKHGRLRESEHAQ